MARKSDGQSSILAYAKHVLMENRSGLVTYSRLTHAMPPLSWWIGSGMDEATTSTAGYLAS